MTFYERYEMLCAEHDMKPQNPKMLEITGVTSGSISGWKNGASPKIEVLIRLSNFFDVTTDYLLGLSEVRKPGPTLSSQEALLLEIFRNSDDMSKFQIIHACMSEQEATVKRATQNVG